MQETMKLSQIKPYPGNPRINDEAVESVAESIRQCGYCAKILVDEDGVILAGHTRYKALKKLGWKECEVDRITGLTEEQKRKYRLLDNKTGELAEWDIGKLTKELDGLDFGDFDFGFDLAPTEEEIEQKKQEELYEKYSQAVGKVQYEPSERKHEISDLYTPATEYDEAIALIENEELRKMLQIRAAWFCEFDFGKIADYYANQATPYEQEVMEMLALVLLDKDNLIKNGFADLLGDVDGLTLEDEDES